MTRSKLAIVRMARSLIDLAGMPVARLCFDSGINPDQIGATYKLFTKRHPKYKLVGNKTLGIALIDLARYRCADDYLRTIARREFAGADYWQARSYGYTVVQIDRNDYVDDIHDIAISLVQRQGATMTTSELRKKYRYVDMANFRYYGVLDREGRLLAYCNFGIYGNFAATDKLLGYNNCDGVMYLLLIEIVCRLIDEGGYSYFMYDSFVDNGPGQSLFKRKIGFQPYRAKYSIQ